MIKGKAKEKKVRQLFNYALGLETLQLPPLTGG